MEKRTLHNNNCLGFTMIELIMVIVIMGILGVVGADFISGVFSGFAKTNSRMELYQEAKAALVRMERELHNMIPNGVCVMADGVNCLADGSAGNEIRFGMIGENLLRANNLVGRYSQTNTELTADPTRITDENSPAALVAGSIISIYNTSWSEFNSGSRLYSVASVDGASGQMTLSSGVSSGSPYQRYYPVSRAVAYEWDSTSGDLSRMTVTVGSTGPAAFTAAKYPLAQSVSDFKIYYAAPSLTRNGIVSILLTLTRNGEQATLHKEIHVKNVP